MNKCPQCDSYETSIIDPPEGKTDYFLSTFNRSDNSIDPSSGMALQAYGCLDCQGVWFKNKNMRAE